VFVPRVMGLAPAGKGQWGHTCVWQQARLPAHPHTEKPGEGRQKRPASPGGCYLAAGSAEATKERLLSFFLAVLWKNDWYGGKEPGSGGDGAEAQALTLVHRSND
jgi:hypothetical protein